MKKVQELYDKKRFSLYFDENIRIVMVGQTVFDSNYDPLKEVHKNKLGETVICLSDYLSVKKIVYFVVYN